MRRGWFVKFKRIMKKLIRSLIIILSLAGGMFDCTVEQIDSKRIPAASADARFFEAKPIWIEDREAEMNLTVGFRACFNNPEAGDVILKIAASTLYRVYLNGQFIGHGPARAAHGYYRIDEWQLTDSMRNDLNIIAIEVAGYNVNSFYLLDQPAFLQAEVLAADLVLCATGKNETGFEAIIVERTHPEGAEIQFSAAVHGMLPT